VSATEPRVVVIGVGNPYRRDDGIGIRVVEALEPGRRPVETRCIDGEPARLIECWRDADLAVVVDAVVAGRPPGTVGVWDPSREPLPAAQATSSHATGVGEAVALADALDALPGRLLIVGVEPAAVDDGEQLSPCVAAAVPAALRLVRAAIATARLRTPGALP
jgi:hydrogenase maturation protease